MKNQVWCEHLIWVQGTDKYDPKCGVYHLLPKEAGMKYEHAVFEHWKFCPICGEPRPVIMSIREILCKYTIPRKGFGDAFDYCQQEIEEHYRGKV